MQKALPTGIQYSISSFSEGEGGDYLVRGNDGDGDSFDATCWLW